ncbi:hypothetical protein QTP88_004726 [Uroleucon formosanum]
MLTSKTSKRNLSSSSSKDSDNKSKIYVTPNRYTFLSEDADPHPEVFSPPPVTISPQVEHISTHINMELPPTTKPHIPPFYVSDGYDFSPLKNSLFKVLEPSSIYFKTTPKYLIINAGSVSANNAISNYLMDNKQIKFHSYLSKSLRTFFLDTSTRLPLLKTFKLELLIKATKSAFSELGVIHGYPRKCWSTTQLI